MPDPFPRLIAAPAGAVGDVTLPQVLDLRAVRPLAEALLERRGGDLTLDAANVQRLGAQSLQVLLAAAKTWAQDGKRLSIASRPGRGSTFSMSLPLTLAVLDGMVVDVAGQTLIAPLGAIVETLQPKAGEVFGLGDGARVISIRGTFVPLVDVGLAMGFRDAPSEASAGVALLVEGDGARRVALLVDDIQGQRQVVIKSLEANYRQVPGVAAATILGDGRVALIMDIDNLLDASRGGELQRSDTKLAATG